MKQDKLPKAFKNKWLKALRSGEYKQGDGKLWNKKDNTYCCLGVAGKLCGVVGLSAPSRWEFLDFKENKNLRGKTRVPEIIQGIHGVADILAGMNDRGDSFKVIANYIEKNL
jgi:hypothetical protein